MTEESIEFKVAKTITENQKILTTYDNEDIFFYEDDYFKNFGETRIKEQIQGILLTRNSNTMTNEILGHIKRSTYIERTELNSASLNLIPVKNGVYDISTGKLNPHLWNYCFTFKIPVEYNPTIKDCPKIRKFLREITENRKDVGLVLESIAYSLYRANPLQKAWMFIGGGSNGKSTLLKLLTVFIGEDSVANVELQNLEENNFAASLLFGKLVNCFADLPSKALKGTGIFKSITGCDRIRAEKKFRDAFFFKPYTKLFFSANTLPQTPDDTDAFYRRWVILKFPKQFLGKEDKKNILDEISTEKELQGLLYICLKLLPKIIRDGRLSNQTGIDEIREIYTRLSDPVGSFILDRVLVAPDKQVPKGQLFEKFLKYCSIKGYPFISEKKFNEALRKDVLVNETYATILGNKRVWCWTGISYVAMDDTDKIEIEF